MAKYTRYSKRTLHETIILRSLEKGMIEKQYRCVYLPHISILITLWYILCFIYLSGCMGQIENMWVGV